MKTIAAFLTATALAAPAFAGGLATPVMEPEVVPAAAPMIVPSTDWSGFYAGAQLGYADVGSSDNSLDGNDWLGGVHAGYRWDLGTTVLGVEGDYNTASVDLNATDSLDSLAHLKLIGGMDLGRTLVYATGGVAWADTTGGSDDGYFLGAGLDYSLNDSWTIGGEILGHRFDDFNGTGVDLDATTVAAKVSFQF